MSRRFCETWDAGMKQVGKKIGVDMYGDAGHAFENLNNQRGITRRRYCRWPGGTVEFPGANLKNN